MRHNFVSFTFFALTLTYCIYAFAHNAPVDEMGCHQDPSNGPYHCLAGPLAGMEFASKSEAEAAFQNKSREVDLGRTLVPDSSAGETDKMAMISWRLKKNAKVPIDVDRAASLLATSDLALFQDVEFNANGESALNVMASVLERRLNEKICRGWIKNAKGVRGTYGFIWRERSIGVVETSGEILESCSNRPWVLRSDKKQSVLATFYWKKSHRLFVLSSAAFDRNQRRPAQAYRGYAEFEWPMVVIGENATTGAREAHQEMKSLGFKASVSAGIKSRRASAAVWHKNLTVLSMASMDLYDLFRDLARREVDERLGESPPLRFEVTFQDIDSEQVQTLLLAKKKGKGPASTKAPVVSRIPVISSSYPAPVKPQELSDLSEDIESEAIQSDPRKDGHGTVKRSNARSTRRRK